jgi:hypothetical protein
LEHTKTNIQFTDEQVREILNDILQLKISKVITKYFNNSVFIYLSFIYSFNKQLNHKNITYINKLLSSKDDLSIHFSKYIPSLCAPNKCTKCPVHKSNICTVSICPEVKCPKFNCLQFNHVNHTFIILGISILILTYTVVVGFYNY